MSMTVGLWQRGGKRRRETKSHGPVAALNYSNESSSSSCLQAKLANRSLISHRPTEFLTLFSNKSEFESSVALAALLHKVEGSDRQFKSQPCFYWQSVRLIQVGRLWLLVRAAIGTVCLSSAF